MGININKLFNKTETEDGMGFHTTGYMRLSGVDVFVKSWCGFGGTTDYYIGKELVAHISHTGGGYDEYKVFWRGDMIQHQNGVEDANELVESILSDLIRAGRYNNVSETMSVLKQASDKWNAAQKQKEDSDIEGNAVAWF